MKKIVTAILALAAFGGMQIMAATEKPERDGKGKPKCEQVRETRMENRASTRAFYQVQRKENKEFREGLDELDPETRIEAIITHRKEQYGQNTKFHKQRYQKMADAVQSCDEIPDDVKAEMLQRLKAHHEEALAFHTGIHRKVMKFLDELKTSDLSPEERKDAWIKFHAEIEKEIQAWNLEHRPDRHERKGPRADEE